MLGWFHYRLDCVGYYDWIGGNCKESHVKGEEKTTNRLIEMREKMEVNKDET